VTQGVGSFVNVTGLCGSAVLQDPGLSQLPLEGFAKGAEAAVDPDTASSSPRPTASAAAGTVDADIDAPSIYAESEAAGSSAGSGKRPKGSKGAGGGISNSRQREEDYFGVCHTDVVKCIVITDNGKIFTAGYVILPATAALQHIADASWCTFVTVRCSCMPGVCTLQINRRATGAPTVWLCSRQASTCCHRMPPLYTTSIAGLTVASAFMILTSLTSPRRHSSA
jgi:hypothetical protein